jgi:multicomponent Na+:H+ antiporter subunit F
MDTASLMTIFCWIASGFLALGMCAAFIRLLLGPSLPDRVVALDLLAAMAIGALVLVAVQTGQPILLDVALAIAIITFLGTVALAMSLERGVFK